MNPNIRCVLSDHPLTKHIFHLGELILLAHFFNPLVPSPQSLTNCVQNIDYQGISRAVGLACLRLLR